MGFSHIDDQGNPSMVDVGDKTSTDRTAVAVCFVDLPPEVAAAFDGDDIHTRKGPVLQTAIIAGVMGAKKTSELIPMCHPLPIENCKIRIERIRDNCLEISCEVRVHHKTGVEMEALTGASIAALTVYDMCKGLSHDILIRDLQLIAKTGGKNDIKKETPKTR